MRTRFHAWCEAFFSRTPPPEDCRPNQKSNEHPAIDAALDIRHDSTRNVPTRPVFRSVPPARLPFATTLTSSTRKSERVSSSRRGRHRIVCDPTTFTSSTAQIILLLLLKTESDRRGGNSQKENSNRLTDCAVRGRMRFHHSAANQR